MFNKEKIEEARKKKDNIVYYISGEIVGLETAVDNLTVWSIGRKKICKLSEQMSKVWYELGKLQIDEELGMMYKSMPISSETQFYRCMNDYKKDLQNAMASIEGFEASKSAIENLIGLLFKIIEE